MYNSRKIDELGRVLLPKEYRDMLKLKAGDSFKVEMIEGKIILIPNKQEDLE